MNTTGTKINLKKKQKMHMNIARQMTYLDTDQSNRISGMLSYRIIDERNHTKNHRSLLYFIAHIMIIYKYVFEYWNGE